MFTLYIFTADDIEVRVFTTQEAAEIAGHAWINDNDTVTSIEVRSDEDDELLYYENNEGTYGNDGSLYC